MLVSFTQLVSLGEQESEIRQIKCLVDLIPSRAMGREAFVVAILRFV
jgi:hypothetical protein